MTAPRPIPALAREHPPLSPEEVRVFSGSSHPDFAAAVARHLGLPLSPARVQRFSNDNLWVQLGTTVRQRTVYIVQSFSPPVSEHIFELLMMIDAARTAGAPEVHAVIPYYSYARSDKKDAPRISITGRLAARLLAAAGATHAMTMTLHAPQVHGFFDVPTDVLTARPVFETYFRGQDLGGTIVVSPDAGRADSAARFAERLGLPVAVGNKHRLADQEVHLTGLIGDLSGRRRAIVYDDEIASGSSVIAMAELLVRHGIESITTVCTHGVFTGRALERLSAVPQITAIVTGDTVPIAAAERYPKLRVLSVAPLFGEAIRRNCQRQSIGDLFAFWEDFHAEA